MIDDSKSQECRRNRHTACPRQYDACDCECHDDESEEAAAGRLARLADMVGPGAHRADPAPGPEMIRCRVADCTHPPFETEQGEKVHFARVHKDDHILPAPRPVVVAPPPAAPELETPAADDGVVTIRLDGDRLLHPLSRIAADVLDAIVYAEGLDQADVIADVLDSWAAETMDRNPEIKQLVALRRSYQKREPD